MTRLLMSAALLTALASCSDEGPSAGAGDAACNPTLSVAPCLARVVIGMSQCIDGAGSCTWSEVADPPHTLDVLQWSNGAKDEIELDGNAYVAQRYTSATGKTCENASVNEAGCNGLRWTVDGLAIEMCVEDNLDAGVSGTTVFRCADGTRHALPVADSLAVIRACRGTQALASGGGSTQCLDAEGNPYTRTGTLPSMAP
jgi:hypothetical protein